MPDWLPQPRDVAVSPPPVPALLINARQAAQALSISPRLLWSLTQRGDVPCLRIGRAVRYDPRDLQAWVDRQKEGGHDR